MSLKAAQNLGNIAKKRKEKKISYEESESIGAMNHGHHFHIFGTKQENL